MRESRCLVHGILNFFFAVLLPYLMLLAMVLSALMTPCAGGPHRSSVFVTVLEYLLMLIPLAGYLASVSALAVRSVKALRRGGSRGMLWAGLGLTLLGIVYLALYVCHPFS